MSAEKVIEMTAAGTDGITAMICGGVVRTRNISFNISQT